MLSSSYEYWNRTSWELHESSESRSTTHQIRLQTSVSLFRLRFLCLNTENFLRFDFKNGNFLSSVPSAWNNICKLINTLVNAVHRIVCFLNFALLQVVRKKLAVIRFTLWSYGWVSVHVSKTIFHCSLCMFMRHKSRNSLLGGRTYTTHLG